MHEQQLQQQELVGLMLVLWTGIWASAYAVAFVEIRIMGDFRLQATDPDKNIDL